MGNRFAGCGGILLLIVLLFLVRQSYADSEEPLFDVQRPSCDIKATGSEAWHTVIFRIANHAGASQACVRTSDDTAGLIALAFSTLALRRGTVNVTGYESVFLGRLIDYEWLSRRLAEGAAADTGWSSATGKPRDGERVEAYVHRLLDTPSVLAVFDENLTSFGYRAAGFSCEKAMVSGPDTKPFQPAWVAADKRLPFDALCHLVLQATE